MNVRVAEVRAADAYDLRRRVLRDDRPDAEVAFPEDDRPDAIHLALVGDDGTPVAVATFAPAATPRRPGASAWRLRGMAVEPSRQGRGDGRALLAAAVDRLRGAGAEVVWADGRDSALGFYTRLGWKVEGEGYITPIGLPHHTVVLDL